MFSKLNKWKIFLELPPSDNIEKDFDIMIDDELVASNLDYQLFLHKFLKFRNQIDIIPIENFQSHKKRIGNATPSTEVFSLLIIIFL